MEDGKGSLPSTINPFTFPAKLWRMVNNTDSNAVRWSKSGDVVFVDRQIIESEILARQTHTSEDIDTFRAKHFTSFIRQLNLYGFSRASWVRREDGIRHQFFHPNFKRGHPELLKNLQRLTVKNKNKWKAGLNQPSKLRGRPRRMCEFGYGPQRTDDTLVQQGQNLPDSSPDQGQENQAQAIARQKINPNAEVMAAFNDKDPGEGTSQHLSQYFNGTPSSSPVSAQQTSQSYSAYSFLPSTYPERFHAPQWPNYNFADVCHVQPNTQNNYPQPNPPQTYYHQGQNTASSTGHYENPPFPANVQMSVSMADTSVFNAMPTNGPFGMFGRLTPQSAFSLSEPIPLDMIEVIIGQEMAQEVTNM